MNIVIQSTLKTLKKAQSLLNNLSDDDLCDSSIAPYNSSVGSHLRHILDFYDCIFNYDKNLKIDLTARSRNTEVEKHCCSASNYLNKIIKNLEKFDLNMNTEVVVIDDLGLGKTEITYSFSALLAQANSHTIHHYAIINYILNGLNISFEDSSDFGYNPTTPKQVSINQ